MQKMIICINICGGLVCSYKVILFYYFSGVFLRIKRKQGRIKNRNMRNRMKLDRTVVALDSMKVE